MTPKDLINAAWAWTVDRVRPMASTKQVAEQWRALADLLADYEKQARARQKLHEA